MSRYAEKRFGGEKVRDISEWKRQSLHLVPCHPAPENSCPGTESALPRLSTAPLTDPADILRQMPTQAISPALLELIDMLSIPILLIEDNPAGELREIPPVPLRKAA